MAISTAAPAAAATVPADLRVDAPASYGRLWRIALVLGLVAVAVSAAGSWIPSLWGDEAASLMSAQRPLPSLFMMLGHVDAVHGSYYLGLHAWIDIFGASPFSIRFPSAIAVGLAVVATVLIAGRLGNTRLAIVAGLLCAVLPRTSYMGEEARSFAFSAAFAAWLTLVLVEQLRRDGRSGRLWLAYGALLAAGTYAFLYLALMVLAHAVVIAGSRAGRRFVVRWLVVCGAALATTLPLVYWALTERAQIAYLSKQSETGFVSLFQGLWFGDALSATVGWLLVVAGLAAAVLAWRGRRRGSPAGGGDAEVRPVTCARPPRLELVAAAWLFVPAGTLVAGQSAFSDFTSRYVSDAAPAAALLMACGIVRLLRRRTLVVAATVLTIACMAPSYLGQRGPYSKNQSDWAEVSATVGAHAKPGDAVAFDETAKPSRNPRLAMHTYPAGFAGLADPTLETPFALNTTWHDATVPIATAVAEDRFDGVHTLWLVEYSSGTHVDADGMGALRGAGFVVSSTFDTHRSVIYELTR